jgi:TPR repeat protein
MGEARDYGLGDLQRYIEDIEKGRVGGGAAEIRRMDTELQELQGEAAGGALPPSPPRADLERKIRLLSSSLGVQRAELNARAEARGPLPNPHSNPHPHPHHHPNPHPHPHLTQTLNLTLTLTLTQVRDPLPARGAPEEAAGLQATLAQSLAQSVAAGPCNYEAMCDLGVCYANGEGVPPDLARAVTLYETAAEGGLAQAQVNLGVLTLTLAWPRRRSTLGS